MRSLHHLGPIRDQQTADFHHIFPLMLICPAQQRP